MQFLELRRSEPEVYQDLVYIQDIYMYIYSLLQEGGHLTCVHT